MEIGYQVRCSLARKRGSDDMFGGIYVRVMAHTYYEAMFIFNSIYDVGAKIEILPEIGLD